MSADGMSIRFPETDVRPTGRVSMGVKGMTLSEGDYCVSMQLGIQGTYMLCITEKGLGKRTPIEEFRIQSRGGKGIKCYNLNERTGRIVDMKMVNEDAEILVVTTEGIIIRTQVREISINGRYASGVKCMQLAEGVLVASFTKVHPEALSRGDESAAGDADEEQEADPSEEKIIDSPMTEDAEDV